MVRNFLKKTASRAESFWPAPKGFALWFLPVVFVAVFFIWPTASIFSRGLTSAATDSGSAIWLTLSESQTIDAAWFTIWQALLSTALTLAIAIPGAYVLYRKSFRGQQFLRVLITIPLVLPTIVVAIIFASFQKAHEVYSEIGINFFAENRVYWIIAAHVFINYAIAVRTIGSFWSGLDRDIDDEAELAGAGRLKAFWLVTLPTLRPAIIAAAALVFLFCFTSFGVVLILGGGQIDTLETQIASSALQFLDLSRASILALVQTVVTVAAFAVSRQFGRGAVGFDAINQDDQVPAIDRRDRPALIATLAYLLFLIVIPLALLMARAFETNEGFGLQNFANLAGRGDRELLNITVWQAALNSLRNLLVAVGLAIPLGLLVAYAGSRRETSRKSGAREPGLTGKLLDALMMLPLGVSSVVLGLGFLVTFGGEPLPIRSSWLVLPIVQALIALPLVIRVIQPALLAISAEQLDAAKNSGASSWQIWWLIELPLIAPAFKTAVVFTVLASVGEFGAATLLVAADQATISTVLGQLISRPGSNNYGMAMAMTALLVAATALLVGLAQLKINTRSRKAL